MVGNNAWETEVKKWIETDYPNLKYNGYEVTSPDTKDAADSGGNLLAGISRS